MSIRMTIFDASELHREPFLNFLQLFCGHVTKICETFCIAVRIPSESFPDPQFVYLYTRSQIPDNLLPKYDILHKNIEI